MSVESFTIEGTNMKIKIGDITTAESGIIIHQVNTIGVMGAGIAKAIRNKWPHVYTKYQEAIRVAGIESGHDYHDKMLGVVQFVDIDENLCIANLFAQKETGFGERRVTSYDALDLCFAKIKEERDGRELHIPQIGCGLGGGNWNIVQSIIKSHLDTDWTYWSFV